MHHKKKSYIYSGGPGYLGTAPISLQSPADLGPATSTLTCVHERESMQCLYTYDGRACISSSSSLMCSLSSFVVVKALEKEAAEWRRPGLVFSTASSLSRLVGWEDPAATAKALAA